jgi:pantoate--beta-alanine ligase
MPTIREPDGLAMSSRNVYLSQEERREARVLYEALKRAEAMIKAGDHEPRKVMKTMQGLISRAPSAKVDYISIVDAVLLKDVKSISGEILIVLAVFIGKTRLIDNIILKGIK